QQAQPAPAEQALAPPTLPAPETAMRPSVGPAPVQENNRPQAVPAPRAAAATALPTPPAPATPGEPQRSALASPARPVPPESSNRPAPAALDTGAASGAKQRMSQPMVDMLLARGDALFAEGDVSGARRFYERAAGGGSARAATTLGKTYDPAFLASIKVRGMQPDPNAAAAWYRTAAGLGDTEAPRLLQRLGVEPNR
ncbi:MAG TPA: hypothetical protein VJ779_09655, partial [Acetobacteraceae bacterium]|nr:hypothetical protein [Acetobacteraceae bacterium]